MPQKNSGFTLLEMSIVIVIISLITGSILMARDMMRSAELRNVVEESQFYIQALNNFVDKYGEMPGDLSNAIDYWGAQHVTPATCITTFSSELATCNGDGNGWITTQGTSGTYYEQFHAWVQLHHAGMTPENTIALTAAGGTQNRVIRYNIPQSELEGAGWGLVGLSVQYVTVTNPNILLYYPNDTPPGHVLFFGGNTYSGALDSLGTQNRLRGAEAKEIDDKIDDGRPNHGKVVVQINRAGTPLCDSGKLVYDISDNNLRCTLIVKTGL